jgi:hypothetical protein
MLRRCWPLAILALACLVYSIVLSHAEAAFELPKTVPGVMWQLGFRHEVLYYAFGAE